MPLTALNTLILIPTYNNAGTLGDVVRRALRQGLPVMVVDDGSTDGTPEILTSLQNDRKNQEWRFPGPNQANRRSRLEVVTHPENRGKGYALKTGFQEASRRGFHYVITLDSDGQHFPEDIPALVAAAGENTLVVGSRPQMGANGGSSFANRFSNFWFRLYTWVSLPDTQTGFRLYPLDRLPSLSLLSSRYEAELSLLVFSAWKGLDLVPVPVKVAYPEDRVSHFRPAADFTRISLLNCVLLLIALVYGWPRTLYNALFE